MVDLDFAPALQLVPGWGHDWHVLSGVVHVEEAPDMVSVDYN